MALNSAATTDMPSVQPQRLATASGNMNLGTAGSVVIPEIPKDAFKTSGPSMWQVVALIELVIIVWLLYRVYKRSAK